MEQKDYGEADMVKRLLAEVCLSLSRVSTDEGMYLREGFIQVLTILIWLSSRAAYQKYG